MGRPSPAHYDDLLLHKLKTACLAALQQLNDEGEIDHAVGSLDPTAAPRRVHGRPIHPSRLYHPAAPPDPLHRSLANGSTSRLLYDPDSLFATDNANEASGLGGYGRPSNSQRWRLFRISSSGSSGSNDDDGNRDRDGDEDSVERPLPGMHCPRRRTAFTYEQLVEHLDLDDQFLQRLCKMMVSRAKRMFRQHQADRDRNHAAASLPSSNLASSARVIASLPSRLQPSARPSVYVGTREYGDIGRPQPVQPWLADSEDDRSAAPNGLPIDLQAPMTIIIGEDGITTHEGVRTRTLSRSLNARVNAINRSLQRLLAARGGRPSNLESDSVASGESLSAQHVRQMAEQSLQQRGSGTAGVAQDDTSDDSSDGGRADEDDVGSSPDAVQRSLPQSMRDALARLGSQDAGADSERDEDVADADVGGGSSTAPRSAAPRIGRAFVRIGREVEFLRSYLQGRIDERISEAWEAFTEVSEEASAADPEIPARGAVRLDPVSLALEASAAHPRRRAGTFVPSREVDRLRSALLKTLETFDTAMGQVWVSGLMEEDADQQLWRLSAVTTPQPQERGVEQSGGTRSIGGMVLDGDGRPLPTERQWERRREMQSSFLRMSLWRTRNRARELEEHADSIAQTFGEGLLTNDEQDALNPTSPGAMAGRDATDPSQFTHITEEEAAHSNLLDCMERYGSRLHDNEDDRRRWRWSLAKWYYLDRPRIEIPDPGPRSQGRPAGQVGSDFAETAWNPSKEDPYAYLSDEEAAIAPPVNDDLERAWAFAADSEFAPRSDVELSEVLASSDVRFALRLLWTVRRRASGGDEGESLARSTAQLGPSDVVAADGRDPTVQRPQPPASTRRTDGDEEGGEVDMDVSLMRSTSLSRRNAIRTAPSDRIGGISSLVGRTLSTRNGRSSRASFGRSEAGTNIEIDADDQGSPFRPHQDRVQTQSNNPNEGDDSARAGSSSMETETEAHRRSGLRGSHRTSLERSRSRSFTFVTTPAAVLGGRGGHDSPNGAATTSRAARNEASAAAAREPGWTSVLGRRRRLSQDAADEDDVDRSLGFDTTLRARRMQNDADPAPPLPMQGSDEDDARTAAAGGDEAVVSGASTPLEARRATFEAYARRRRSRFHEMLLEAAASDAPASDEEGLAPHAEQDFDHLMDSYVEDSGERAHDGAFPAIHGYGRYYEDANEEEQEGGEGGEEEARDAAEAELEVESESESSEVARELGVHGLRRVPRGRASR
ncbi:hypothetical protein ACQY0O_004665 [Thecaphora frezii]